MSTCPQLEAHVTTRVYRVVKVYIPGLVEVSDVETGHQLMYNKYLDQLSCPYCNTKTVAFPAPGQDPLRAKANDTIVLQTATLHHSYPHEGEE